MEFYRMKIYLVCAVVLAATGWFTILSDLWRLM